MGEVQRLASTIVAHVLAGRSLDAELRGAARLAESLSPQERAALHDIAYGTLRFLGEIDAILEQLCERPLKD
jgi:16S rRNA (cytosine967-C5)-methyltransferase